MFETMTATVESSLPLADLVAFCQSAESRKCWPGTSNVVPQAGGFLFRMDLHVPGVPSGELVVEEHYRPAEQSGAGISFESAQLWYWPTGDPSSAWMTYRFTPHGGETQVELTLRYLLPGSPLGRLINRTRFARTMEDNARQYLASVVAQAMSPSSAVTSSSMA